MFCHKCGKKNDSESIFCIYCGTILLDDFGNNKVSNSISVVEHNNTNDINADFLECNTQSEKQNESYIHYDEEINNKPKAKIVHDVNINVGKSTLICISLISIIILILIIIYYNNQSEKETFTDISVENIENKVTNTPSSYENDIERWDAYNGVYSNYKYGIAFNLLNRFCWQKLSGTAKHTVVKFVQPETQLTLFVNINPIEGKNDINDIWDFYDKFKKIVTDVILNDVNKNNAEKVKDINFKKAEICGKHAIKSRYISELGDDRFENKSIIITVDYTFIFNNAITTLTVKCPEKSLVQLNDKGFDIEDFIKGFQLLPCKQNQNL